KSDPANGHGAVGAAETEGIGNRHVDLHVPRLVGAVIQVAFRILVEDVDGGRRLLVVDRQGGEHGLDAAGGAQQVAGHGLGGVDHQLLGVVAESQFQGVGLVLVAQGRGSAVRVD